jgi:hypothetical protein
MSPSRFFDAVEMSVVIVLRCPRFQRDHGAAMHVSEVTERKAVAPFGVRRLVGVDTEMPQCELLDAVLFDEPVFIIGRRCVFAPVVALVAHHLPVFNEASRVG